MDAHAIESDVLLARGGDHAAFHRLVTAGQQTVCSIALAIVRNVQASEDVAQETFLAAWKNLHSLRNPASFLPWLRQMTRNQAHHWRREHAREVSDDAVLASVGDARPSAEESLVRSEEQRLLDEMLDAMEADDREVLVLYYREGRSTRQVAELLELREDSVRQRVSRARARLREEMLEKFGSAVVRTAPGVAFGTAIAAALAAPTASAALATSKAAVALGAKSTVGLAGAAGALLGWTGVILGMDSLEPAYDEREARELRRFRNVVLLIITAGCFVIPLCRSSMLLLLVAMQSTYAAVILPYIVWLPRILERRMRSISPELAGKTRRQWMWAAIKRAVVAAIGGAMVMAALMGGMFG